ncbi:hypothetical protein [Micromonospora sp. C41]|uniref:hypothetical protein n=1 Tax=Micromonospora sp. C41 TaxID=2824878 RepID=UPI001B389CA5|nr:hypothetical protein [Micromonospora sp. C41]MBQ1061306.1 hypothetical protein [Micromonospora sp. C41]
MQIIDLSAALAGLGAIALGLGGLFAFGRDRTADQHDVSDYLSDAPAPAPVVDRPGLAPARRDWPLVDVDSRPAGRRSLRPGALLALADPADSAVTPLLARRLLVEQAVPSLSDAAVRGIADEWLREIAEEQRALAGAR